MNCALFGLAYSNMERGEGLRETSDIAFRPPHTWEHIYTQIHLPHTHLGAHVHTDTPTIHTLGSTYTHRHTYHTHS